MTKLTPDEWASWVLMGDVDKRWPTPLNELARRVKQAIVEDRLMQQEEQSPSHLEASQEIPSLKEFAARYGYAPPGRWPDYGSVKKEQKP